MSTDSKQRAVLLVSDPLGNQSAADHFAGSIRNLLAGESTLRVLRSPSSDTVSASDSDVIEDKAEPVTMAAIALAIVTSGAAVALVNAIRAALPSARDTDLHFKFTAPDGTPVEFTATELTSTQADALIQKIERLLPRHP